MASVNNQKGLVEVGNAAMVKVGGTNDFAKTFILPFTKIDNHIIKSDLIAKAVNTLRDTSILSTYDYFGLAIHN